MNAGCDMSGTTRITGWSGISQLNHCLRQTKARESLESEQLNYNGHTLDNKPLIYRDSSRSRVQVAGIKAVLYTLYSQVLATSESEHLDDRALFKRHYLVTSFMCCTMLDNNQKGNVGIAFIFSSLLQSSCMDMDCVFFHILLHLKPTNMLYCRLLQFSFKKIWGGLGPESVKVSG